MTFGASAATSSSHSNIGSSYRVKFRRSEFLELIEIVRPSIIYHVKRMHFFAHDGFVMYTFQCDDEDFFNFKLIHAIEFTNYLWKEE
ncbi:MAG: hypothetical protein EAX86_10170 [Candidatus Heimdallarchaeota archaeon]|nr:hypothetical protein [Candidatus Heimdallarchaeota archaeon]